MSTFARGNYKAMKDCGGFSVPVTFMPHSSSGSESGFSSRQGKFDSFMRYNGDFMKKLIVCVVLLVGISSLAQAQSWASSWEWPIVPVLQSYTVGEKPVVDWSDGPPILDEFGYPVKWWLDRHPEYLKPEQTSTKPKKQ